MNAEHLIQQLGLEPLPVEGGYFRQTYCSEEGIAAQALPSRYGREKLFCTAIYYLLTSDADSFSALHRLPTDEIYHFYLGDPVEMLLLHPDGRSERAILGQNLVAGQKLQFAVPRDVWQGSRLMAGGRFALLGTTMAPGFDPQDFTLGDRAALTRLCPREAASIRILTRC